MLYPDLNSQKKPQKNSTRYRTALYLRLSREDGDKTESDSIANQRTLLEAYAADHPELCIVDEFVDDGYSGSNFERPAFQRLFQELEQGTMPEFHAGRGFEGRANVVDQLPRAALGIVGPVEADGKGFVGIEKTVWVGGGIVFTAGPSGRRRGGGPGVRNSPGGSAESRGTGDDIEEAVGRNFPARTQLDTDTRDTPTRSAISCCVRFSLRYKVFAHSFFWAFVKSAIIRPF